METPAAGAAGGAPAVEDVTCTVCLQLYRDPVVLPCKHVFCLSCIEEVWLYIESTVCPHCRTTFTEKPYLQGDPLLSDAVQKYKDATEPAATAAGLPLCDFCTSNRLPAVKTCLKCEVSFCKLHLQPHLVASAFQGHNLVEPIADLAKRKCANHNQLYDQYCASDRQFACMTCSVTDEHKDHKLVRLEEAKPQIEQLTNMLRKKMNDYLKTQQTVMEKELQMQITHIHFTFMSNLNEPKLIRG
nr:PREDICTED: E3 ubiquitin/ISG15 ligase TRIM25-like [Latimeria chalumnae]|eukprot:XP_014347474.1 PREDICTED: E3 ubiquitin/ISG15 ligase TRIM25-like [Latimeria chalumnae]